MALLRLQAEDFDQNAMGGDQSDLSLRCWFCQIFGSNIMSQSLTREYVWRVYTMYGEYTRYFEIDLKTVI